MHLCSKIGRNMILKCISLLLIYCGSSFSLSVGTAKTIYITTRPRTTTTTASIDLLTQEEEIKIKKEYPNIHYSDLFYPTEGGEYKVSMVRRNWTDAAKECYNIGMELLSIQYENDQLRLFKFLYNNNLIPGDEFSGYWLSGLESPKGMYYWETIKIKMGCWGWLPEEPSKVDDLEHCVELKFLPERVLLGWNNLVCEQAQRFICGQPEDAVIKESFPIENDIENNRIEQRFYLETLLNNEVRNSYFNPYKGESCYYGYRPLPKAPIPELPKPPSPKD